MRKVYTAADVRQLMEDVGEIKAKRRADWQEGGVSQLEARVKWEHGHPAVEWEVTRFGLHAEVHDPLTGVIVVAADPYGVLLTPKQVDDALWAARKPLMDKAAADAKSASDAARKSAAAAAKAEVKK